MRTWPRKINAVFHPRVRPNVRSNVQSHVQSHVQEKEKTRMSIKLCSRWQRYTKKTIQNMHTRTRSLSVNWTTTTGCSCSLFTRPARVALLKFFLLVCTACCVNSMDASTLESYKIVEYTAGSMKAIVTWKVRTEGRVILNRKQQVWTSVHNNTTGAARCLPFHRQLDRGR